jgi:hypothetical protein
MLESGASRLALAEGKNMLCLLSTQNGSLGCGIKLVHVVVNAIVNLNAHATYA